MKPKLQQIRKAAQGSILNGSLQNHSINAGAANESDFVFNYAEKTENLQSNLTEHLMQNKKVVRLHRCFGCKKHFGIKKMSCLLIFCRNCFAAAQGKKQIARRNFVDRALSECRIFLGGRI